MATVVISHDPAGITKNQTFEVDGCVIQWLVGRYPKGFKVPTQVYRNSPSNEIDLRDFPNGLITNDIIIVAHQPAGGAETLLNPFFFIPATIDFLESLVPVEPSYDAPENFDASVSGSPNNRINGQTNLVRLTEKLPQVYGKFRCYPDTLFPSYGLWVNNEWILVEYFLVSEGDKSASLAEKVRRDNTELRKDSIFSIYDPRIPGLPEGLPQNNGWTLADLYSGLYIDPSNLIWNVREISGSEKLYLKGDNIGGDTVGLFGDWPLSPRVGIGYVRVTGSYNTDLNAITFGTDGPYDSIYEELEYAASNLNPGDTVELETDAGPITFLQNAHVVDSVEIGTDGSFKYTNIFFTEQVAQAAGADIPYWMENLDFLQFSGNTVLGPGDKRFGPFLTPIESDGALIDVSTPQGFVGESGDPRQTEIEIEYQLESGGTLYSETKFIEGASRNPRNITYDIQFPSKGIWNIWITRQGAEDLDPGAANKVYCDKIKPYENIDTSNDDDQLTTLLVKTKVENDQIRSGKVNLYFTRSIPIFDYGTKTFGSQAQTSRFDLILLHHMVNVASVPLSQINLDDLQQIVSDMPSNLIQFNGTFAGKNTPLDSDIAAICGAARVSSYKQGSQYRFYGDYAKPVTMVFGITDKEPNSDNKTVKMQLLNDFDGVELEFKNAENDFQSETIYVPDTAARRKKIQGVGITDYDQALSRANYEYNRLRYQRTSFKTTVTNKGIIPDLGDVVRISDETRGDSMSAEVLSISGSDIVISEKLQYSLGTTGQILYGDYSVNVEVTAENTLTQLSGSPTDLEARGENGNQKGTTIIFVTNGDISDYPKWMITNKSYSKQSVTLECVNYDERLYDGDS